MSKWRIIKPSSLTGLISYRDLETTAHTGTAVAPACPGRWGPPLDFQQLGGKHTENEVLSLVNKRTLGGITEITVMICTGKCTKKIANIASSPKEANRRNASHKSEKARKRHTRRG